MKNNSKPKYARKKKLSKKSRARLRRIRRFILVILVFTGIVLFARSSLFTVDKIIVTGNQKYSSNDIIQHTGFATGRNVFDMLGEKPKNLLSFRFIDREQDVYKAMPYIGSVSIRPLLPDSIRIRVQERIPFAILEANGTSTLIDREGYALEKIEDTGQKSKYFKIMGILVDSVKPGEAVKFKGVNPLIDLTGFCDALIKDDNDEKSKVKLYGKISSIDLSDSNGTLVEFDRRITVKFGDPENVDYEIRFFKQLFVNNITANQKGTLDFTKSSNPYFVPKK